MTEPMKITTLIKTLMEVEESDPEATIAIYVGHRLIRADITNVIAREGNVTILGEEK